MEVFALKCDVIQAFRAQGAFHFFFKTYRLTLALLFYRLVQNHETPCPMCGKISAEILLECIAFETDSGVPWF